MRKHKQLEACLRVPRSLFTLSRRHFIIPRKTKVYGSFFNPNSDNRSASMVQHTVLKQAHGQNQVALAEAPSPTLYDTFDEYCIPKAMRETIAENFRAVTPTDIQRRTLPYLLRRDSVALSAPSGVGKTLTYLLPVYMNMQKDRDVYKVPTRTSRPRTILMLPTQELCDQVQRQCAVFNEAMGFHSTIYKGQSRAKRAWNRMRKHNRLLMDVLVTTPKMVRTQIENRRLFLDDLRYVVIDEAEVLVSEKHQFTASHVLNRIRDRNHYQWLWPVQTQYIFVSSVVTGEFNKVLQSAFPKILRISSPGLHKPPANLMHRFIHVRSSLQKVDYLCYLMKRAGYLENSKSAPITRVSDFSKDLGGSKDLAHTDSSRKDLVCTTEGRSTQEPKSNSKEKAIHNVGTKRVLIFFSKIETCTAVFYKLQGRGFPVAQMHSMLPLPERSRVYQQWADGKIPILCTTDLLSIGIDQHIDFVINHTMPNHAVTYLRRAGRAGRMGAKGLVVSFFTKSQCTIVKAMRGTLLKKRPLNDLGNWWAHYKPTYREWVRRKRNAVSKKFVHLILRRTVPKHLEKTFIAQRGTLKLPWHPKTVQFHSGIPERQHARIERKRQYMAHEARKEILARRKKGTARFGRSATHRFGKSFKSVETGYEKGDAGRIADERRRGGTPIAEKYGN